MIRPKVRPQAALLAVFLLTLLGSATATAGHVERSVPATAAPATRDVETMNEDTLEVRLTADPVQISMGELDHFTLTVAATNRGDEVVDPQMYLTRLLVNGEDSMDFSLAISNGLREEKWFALPPGETVSITWSTMGPSLFPAPGEYTLTPQYQGRALDSVMVDVRD